MFLTHPDAWNVYAGGTCAASDRHSYDVQTTIGDYNIWPISAKNNCEHHIGYRVYFLNVKGHLTGGLWQTLANLTTLPEARRLCRNHLEQHDGDLQSSHAGVSA